MAAMEERITSDAAIAGLQACLLLDGSLRLRYAKVCIALQHNHSLSHHGKLLVTCLESSLALHLQCKGTGCLGSAFCCHSDGQCTHAECGTEVARRAQCLVQSAIALWRSGGELAHAAVA